MEKSAYSKVYGVGGEILNVLGCVKVNFNIGTSTFSQVFHVFQRLHNNCILGVDFLKKYKCVIDFSENQLKIKNELVASVCSSSSSFCLGLARACKDITLQPRGQTVIPVRLSKIPNNTVALIEPVSSLHGLGSKCFVTSMAGKSNFLMLNPFDFEIKISKTQVVGKLFAVDSVADSNEGCMPTTEGKNIHVLNVSLGDEEQFLKNAKGRGEFLLGLLLQLNFKLLFESTPPPSPSKADCSKSLEP